MTATPITLFLVDDHTLLRRGLVALLSQYDDLRVVGEAGDAAQALHLLPQLRPDVILLDNHLPGVRGVDAIAGLREAAGGSRVIMLTVSEAGAVLATALRHGAQGYLLKTIDGDLLAQALVHVHSRPGEGTRVLIELPPSASAGAPAQALPSNA